MNLNVVIAETITLIFSSLLWSSDDFFYEQSIFWQGHRKRGILAFRFTTVKYLQQMKKISERNLVSNAALIKCHLDRRLMKNDTQEHIALSCSFWVTNELVTCLGKLIKTFEGQRSCVGQFVRRLILSDMNKETNWSNFLFSKSVFLNVGDVFAGCMHFTMWFFLGHLWKLDIGRNTYCLTNLAHPLVLPI